jgi:hypothetical protein
VKAFSLAVFPLLFVAFVALYLTDQTRYLRILDEDGPVEWATVGLLVAAAAGAAWRARPAGSCRRFWVGVALLCMLAAIEEISWGQRVIQVPSPGFFVRNSDQKEINLHNVFQQWSGLTTKLVAAVVLVPYGVLLPLLAPHVPALRAAAGRWGIVVPPRALAAGFLLGSILMIDLPTYEEEEIAELFFGLCLVLLVADPEE